MFTLYSVRYSIAKGYHVKAERECLKENAAAWLEIYTQDEKQIKFAVCNKVPTLKQMQRNKSGYINK